MKFLGIFFIVIGIILGSISVACVTPPKLERDTYTLWEAIEKVNERNISFRESCYASIIYMMSSSFCFSLGFGLFFFGLARKPQDNLIQNKNVEVKEDITAI